MAKKKYRLNPDTLGYEVVAPPMRLRTYRFLRKVLIGFILASVVNFVFSYFFITPKMYAINRENNELLLKYNILNDKISSSSRKISDIRQRDNQVYRLLFGVDTINIPGIYDPYPAEKYASFAGSRFSMLMLTTWGSLDQLTKQVYLQSVSMDDLQSMSLDKEAMALAVPAIWPVDKRQLTGHIGGFGGRHHPILRRYLMHKGIDLPAKRGTPIYATGNGTVEIERNGGYGYGKQVLVNHGFGYKTRYAHLNKVYVVPGQKVIRGEVIGEVGSTGRSTGPHLHYEVIYIGHAVDPINYFRRDMDDAEFDRIIQSVKETTYETL